MFANEGSLFARMRRMAETINSQEQLDTILHQVPPQIAAGFLEKIGPFLKFQPSQIEKLEATQPVAESEDLQTSPK